MRLAKQLLVLSFTALFLIGCMGGDGKEGKRHSRDFLPPIEIKIPTEIKSDAELTALVKESEVAINQFSDNMEHLIEDMKPFEGKKEEDLGTFDKIKIAQLGLEFFSNSSEGLEVIEKLNNYADQREAQQKPLTDEQIKAIAVIHDTFKERMKQLSEKYKKTGSKDE